MSATITSLTLITEVTLAGYGSPVQPDLFSVVDRVYAKPTLEFLEGAFSKSLWSVQNFFGAASWSEEANDCDDFARCAAFLAQLLHYRTPGRPPASALAVGELWYVRDNGEGHAINIAFTDKGVVCYEPQTRAIVTLSPAEKNNCFKIRF